MSQTFAERCAAAVAAVPHGPDCDLLETHGYAACTCDRDARIGKGLAAMYAAHTVHTGWHEGGGYECVCGKEFGPVSHVTSEAFAATYVPACEAMKEHCRAEALAAFTEAAK